MKVEGLALFQLKGNIKYYGEIFKSTPQEGKMSEAAGRGGDDARLSIFLLRVYLMPRRQHKITNVCDKEEKHTNKV